MWNLQQKKDMKVEKQLRRDEEDKGKRGKVNKRGWWEMVKISQ